MVRPHPWSHLDWVPGRRLPAVPACAAALLAVVLAGALLAGCQASQPSTSAGAAPATAASMRSPTTAEVTRLKAAVERWRIAKAVRALGLRRDLKAALRVWTFRRDVRLAIANHQARAAYIALIRRVSGKTGAAGIQVWGTLGGVSVARDPTRAVSTRERPTRPLAAFAAAPNQCPIDLGGSGNPPPVAQATLRWLGGQPPIDEEPPPVSAETMQWLEQQAAEPPPVSQETLDWIAQNEHDTNPPPVSEETLQWIEDHDATAADPPPVSQETLDWIAEQEAAAPPPVSQETLDWIAQHEATDAEPPPVSQETLDWIAEQEAAGPPPVSQETLDWIAQNDHDTNPPPVSQETLDWIAQNDHDTNPPPVSQETLDWLAAQEDAASNPPPISDELQRWLDEHEGGGPSSPPASAPAATPAPSTQPCGWSIDQPSGGGRIKGRHCGDVPGTWVVDGTYDVGGLKGTQTWTITISANGSTGSFTYKVKSQGKPFGAPVTVYLTGRASGTVTLAIHPTDGTAQMVMTETMHVYLSTTNKGGAGYDQNAPLETYRLDWPADPTC